MRWRRERVPRDLSMGPAPKGLGEVFGEELFERISTSPHGWRAELETLMLRRLRRRLWRDIAVTCIPLAVIAAAWLAWWLC